MISLTDDSAPQRSKQQPEQSKAKKEVVKARKTERKRGRSTEKGKRIAGYPDEYTTQQTSIEYHATERYGSTGDMISRIGDKNGVTNGVLSGALNKLGESQLKTR